MTVAVGDGDVAALKARARGEARARRAAALAAPDGPARVAAALDRLAAALGPWRGRTLAGYLPLPGEPDPRPLLADWDGPVCVPGPAEPGRPLRFLAWRRGAETMRGPFGVPVPRAGAELGPEVLVVPMLAFDGRGARLGQGGGHYDRTLAGLRARGMVVAAGLALAAQETADLPREPTDEPLDLVATERAVRWFGAPARRPAVPA